jgi:hypothetical protein
LDKCKERFSLAITQSAVKKLNQPWRNSIASSLAYVLHLILSLPPVVNHASELQEDIETKTVTSRPKKDEHQSSINTIDFQK